MSNSHKYFINLTSYNYSCCICTHTPNIYVSPPHNVRYKATDQCCGNYKAVNWVDIVGTCQTVSMPGNIGGVLGDG